MRRLIRNGECVWKEIETIGAQKKSKYQITIFYWTYLKSYIEIYIIHKRKMYEVFWKKAPKLLNAATSTYNSLNRFFLIWRFFFSGFFPFIHSFDMYVTLFISSHVYRYLLSSLLFVLLGVLDGTNKRRGCFSVSCLIRSNITSSTARLSDPTCAHHHQRWMFGLKPVKCFFFFFFFLFVKMLPALCTQRDCFLNHCHADKVIDYKLKCMKRPQTDGCLPTTPRASTCCSRL